MERMLRGGEVAGILAVSRHTVVEWIRKVKIGAIRPPSGKYRGFLRVRWGKILGRKRLIDKNLPIPTKVYQRELLVADSHSSFWLHLLGLFELFWLYAWIIRVYFLILLIRISAFYISFPRFFGITEYNLENLMASGGSRL